MASRAAPPGQGDLGRADLEMELARLALAVGRPASRDGAANDPGAAEAADAAAIEWFQAQSLRLLERTPPELRSLVESRIEALADAAARRDLLAEFGPPVPFDPGTAEAHPGR